MAMAVGLIGAVVSGIGSFMQMQAQAQAAEYNAEVAERNRRAITAQTQNDINDKRVHDRRVLASIRAGYSQNGFELAGSPMDVLSDTIFEQEYDVAKLEFAGKMKAEGYREQATLYEMEADAASTASVFGLATGLLSGIGNAYSSAGPGQSIFA